MRTILWFGVTNQLHVYMNHTSLADFITHVYTQCLCAVIFRTLWQCMMYQVLSQVFSAGQRSCIWQCMAVYGSEWQRMAVNGSAWQCMAVYGSEWQCMAVYGSAWQ